MKTLLEKEYGNHIKVSSNYNMPGGHRGRVEV